MKELKFIHDVLLVPELNQNMISVSQLLKDGYGVCFKANYCLIADSYGGEIVKVKMDRNSFYLKLDVMRNYECDGRVYGSMVCYERIGNENSKTLTCMEDYGIVAEFFKIVECDDMDEKCDVVSNEVHFYGCAYLNGNKQNVMDGELNDLCSIHVMDGDGMINVDVGMNGSCLKIKLMADVYGRWNLCLEESTNGTTLLKIQEEVHVCESLMEASKYWCSRINVGNDLRRSQMSSILHGSKNLMMMSSYADIFQIADVNVQENEEFKKNGNVNLMHFRSAIFDV